MSSAQRAPQNSNSTFTATGWKGGAYGLKVSIADRKWHFERSWERVRLVFPSGETVEVNIAKKSFWNDTCRELIGAGIGRWLMAEKLAPWKKGRPPLIKLCPRGDGIFDVSV
jgi:hypothetical protein